jgi:Uma2 family endonuclease
MTPSYNHSYLAYHIGKMIDRGNRYNIHIELGLDIDGTEYIPDVAVYPKRPVDFVHDMVKVKEMPILAVEILSPTQNVQELVEKAEVYLKKGIPSVWLVIPPAKTIILFHDIHCPVSCSRGKLVDEALNLEIQVEEIFQ